MKKLTVDDIEWTVSCVPEYDNPENHFATGDDEMDKEIVQKIRSDMQWNEWAWCMVKVSGEWNGIKACSYLGACSYASEKEFRKDGYFEDMQAEVLAEIQSKVETLAQKINALECDL